MTAIHSKNNTKPINTLHGQNADLLKAKARGTYNYHSALNVRDIYKSVEQSCS
jgi:hypothetical protein